MAEVAVPALISGAAAIGSSAINANAQRKAAQQVQDMAPPTLSYDEALEQAQGVLNPLYDEQLMGNLESVDRGNLSRGFYGQMPGDALKRSTALDVERARAGQIASLSQQMMGQSQQNALQQQQLAAQYALNKGQQTQNWLGLGLNAANSWYNMTGQVPFMGNPLVDKDGNVDMTKATAKQTLEIMGSQDYGTKPSVPTSTGTGLVDQIQRPLAPQQAGFGSTPSWITGGR